MQTDVVDRTASFRRAPWLAAVEATAQRGLRLEHGANVGPLFHVGNFDTFSHTAVGHRKAQYCLSINGAFPWNGTTAFWFVNSCSPVAGPV